MLSLGDKQEAMRERNRAKMARYRQRLKSPNYVPGWGTSKMSVECYLHNQHELACPKLDCRCSCHEDEFGYLPN